jgi:hypothetical protein
MPLDLNTPGVVNVHRPADVTFTHIQLVGLTFELPPLPIQARIRWLRGELVAGAFVPLSSHETSVPTAPTVAWLQQINTAAKKNFIKLEEAMFNYLVSIGEITPGTVVELP